jgi:hypothetical protein
MREIRTSGSVGAPGGNPRGYPTRNVSTRMRQRARESYEAMAIELAA